MLEIHPAPSLHVQVLEKAGGKPLGGATVGLVWSDVKQDYTTDANGDVTIPGLTPEVWTIARVQKVLPRKLKL